MAIGVRILSDNLSGLTTNVTYLPISGGTIDLGVQTFPFNYISDYYFGTYNCYVPTYATMYSVVVPGPTPTPTLTNTPTNTQTPTNTSTTTQTPTPTPSITSSPTETPINTPTNTQTPTNTPTPTQTIGYYQYTLGTGLTENDACVDFSGAPNTIYGTVAGGIGPNVGEFLYYNSGLSTPVINGYYSNGTAVYLVTGGSGEITGVDPAGC
jgi:hypothetical protein